MLGAIVNEHLSLNAPGYKRDHWIWTSGLNASSRRVIPAKPLYPCANNSNTTSQLETYRMILPQSETDLATR